jgi:hypothetical protein
MRTTTIRTSLDEILELWEKNFHRLSYENRKAFKAHRDAKALTSYSRFQIERAMTFGKAKYLGDIRGFLKSNEVIRGSATKFHTSYRVEAKRRDVNSTPSATQDYYLCRMWQVHFIGQICICGRDE